VNGNRKLVPGDVRPLQQPVEEMLTPDFRAFDNDDIEDDELIEKQFQAAVRKVDLDRFNPAPRTTTPWRSYGRALYLHFVTLLKDRAENTNLLDPTEFHHLLWLVVKLGAEPKYIAESQRVPPTVVSRWVTGKQTPEASRRRMILEAAFTSLTNGIDAKELLPMMDHVGMRGAALAACRAATVGERR